MYRVGCASRADDVDTGRYDTDQMCIGAILGYHAGYASVLIGLFAVARDEIAHRVEPCERPSMFLRECDEFVRDLDVDREAMRQTAVRAVHAGALMTDQRRV